jgi:hypothetical protein
LKEPGSSLHDSENLPIFDRGDIIIPKGEKKNSGLITDEDIGDLVF